MVGVRTHAVGPARAGDRQVQRDGGDSPAWSRKRGPYRPVPLDPARVASRAGAAVVPYAELHAHSHYSFLDGASSPEKMVEEAVRLGLHALALTDHDGFYGIVRMAEAAEAYELKTVFGAELSLGLSKPQQGEADPEGDHLLVLARQEEGYHRLAGAMTSAHLAADAEKGHPIYDLDELAHSLRNHCLVLTGCRKGSVRRALMSDGEQAAAFEVDGLIERFGRENVVVELFDHGNPSTAATTMPSSGLPSARAYLSSPATPYIMRPRRDIRWQRPWRRSGHAAAWRSWTGGCPQAAAPICGAVPRW
ncbi:error-prone DNA polymerase [Arthrobacter sp. Hiyo8]|nr:error-prone DNA polymerase [Arthrobacter sp. Hiyo8]